MINLEIERNPLWSTLAKLTQRRYELSYMISKTTDIDELANLEWEKKGIEESIKILHKEINKKGTSEDAPTRKEIVSKNEPFNKEDINDKA